MAAVSEAEVESVLVASGRFSEVSSVCDSLELEAAAYGRLSGYAPLYSLQLLGHLFNNDLVSARLLWKRIPADVKSANAEVAAAWRIGQGLWQHSPSSVQLALREFAWSPRTRPLVDALSDKILENTLSLLQESYSTIIIDKAPTLLGLPAQEASATLQRHGWKLDAATQSLSWDGDTQKGEDALVLDQVKKLTEYVLNLEQ